MSGFNIFKGLVTNGFAFRGVDSSDGATFEHTCGYVVRIGPGAHISLIAEEVRTHRCDVEQERADIFEEARRAIEDGSYDARVRD